MRFLNVRKRTQAIKLRELSKTQNLQAATIIIACILIIYAVGIATDFFRNPIFSMFFIISYETAHNVVTYVAAAIAIALTIMTLTIILIKKRKTGFPRTHIKPVIGPIKAVYGAPVRLTPPTNNREITEHLESSKTEQEKQSVKQPIMQPTKQSMTQIPTQPSANGNTVTNQEAVINKDKITCSTCKKEFFQPLFSLDYSNSLPRLIRLCPYCKQSLEAQLEDTSEDWWVRNFSSDSELVSSSARARTSL